MFFRLILPACCALALMVGQATADEKQIIWMDTGEGATVKAPQRGGIVWSETGDGSTAKAERDKAATKSEKAKK